MQAALNFAWFTHLRSSFLLGNTPWAARCFPVPCTHRQTSPDCRDVGFSPDRKTKKLHTKLLHGTGSGGVVSPPPLIFALVQNFHSCSDERTTCAAVLSWNILVMAACSPCNLKRDWWLRKWAWSLKNLTRCCVRRRFDSIWLLCASGFRGDRAGTLMPFGYIQWPLFCDWYCFIQIGYSQTCNQDFREKESDLPVTVVCCNFFALRTCGGPSRSVWNLVVTCWKDLMGESNRTVVRGRYASRRGDKNLSELNEQIPVDVDSLHVDLLDGDHCASQVCSHREHLCLTHLSLKTKTHQCDCAVNGQQLNLAIVPERGKQTEVRTKEKTNLSFSHPTAPGKPCDEDSACLFPRGRFQHETRTTTCAINYLSTVASKLNARIIFIFTRMKLCFGMTSPLWSPLCGRISFFSAYCFHLQNEGRAIVQLAVSISGMFHIV